MALEVDLKVFGDKKLSRAMGKLEAHLQKVILNRAMKASAARLKAPVIAKLMAHKRTGALIEGFRRAKIRVGQAPKGQKRIGIVPPTRAELHISADSQGYYPYALEYGTIERKGPRGSVAELRYIRNAVDEHESREIAAIKRDIEKGVRDEWARLNA